MLLNKRTAFVVFGALRAPEAHLITDEALRAFEERLSIAERRTRDPAQARTLVYAATFGPGADYARPCTAGAMEFMALQYVGPHADLLKALCARILLGQPIGGDAQQPRGSDGGIKEKAPTRAPVKPRPGGAAVAVPTC
jgi:hypothetical protein